MTLMKEENKANRGNGKADSYRYYVCPLKIDGEDYTAKIVVGKKNGSRYYDHRLTQIEKGKLLDSIEANQAVKPSSSTELSSTSSSGAASQSRPTNRGNTSDAPVFVGKDKRLLSILQTNTNKFYLHEVVLQKNLLDESIKTDTEADSHRGDVAKLLKDFEKAHDGGKKISV